jgi:hypothetical protein
MLRKPSSEPFWETLNRLLNIKMPGYYILGGSICRNFLRLNYAHMVTLHALSSEELGDLREFISSGREVWTSKKFYIETQKNLNVAPGDFNRPI